MKDRDTQLIELAGRHRLIGELLLAGLEVAIPARDRGVDLIAYLDLSEKVDTFVAKPIQIKVSSKRAFSIDRKYERICNLIIAYVWNLGQKGEETQIYALTYQEAVVVATHMDWTKTASWTEKRYYTNNSPGKRLLDQLEPFRMTPEKWWTKIRS